MVSASLLSFFPLSVLRGSTSNRGWLGFVFCFSGLSTLALIGVEILFVSAKRLERKAGMTLPETARTIRFPF